MTTYCVVDATNLLFRSFYANKDEEDITSAGLAMFSALLTVNKYFKAAKPDKTILLFDRPNWRKPYTKSDLCISKKIYKANRRKDQTKSQKEKFISFLAHMDNFEKMMKKRTSVVCLSGPLLEADDLAGGFIQRYASNDNKIVIISSDKDYIQLLKYPNTQLIDPASGKHRTLDDWQGDADLFMFEKCIRGDAGDNVQSAYPRCRKTRILKAYKDPLEYTNLMHETWTHVDGRTMLVKDMFAENELLMGLTQQPPEIQELIQNTIEQGMDNCGTFSHFHFLKFCGKYELKKVAQQAEQFVPLLNS
jgi:hypothetical protein